MIKILLYSFLLLLGLVGSQFRAGFGEEWIKLGVMFSLSFILIYVGYEFEIDKSNPKKHGWDYIVAFTAAAFPWMFCAAYFIWMLDMNSWNDAVLLTHFSSPTSAGVLFSMLTTAGLASTWVFRKIRLLAIFDDLNIILLMIPLKIMKVGLKSEILLVLLLIVFLLCLGWRYLHLLRLPIRWPWVIFYALIITGLCETLDLSSKVTHDTVSAYIEVLFFSFVLGCILARPPGENPDTDDKPIGHLAGPEDSITQLLLVIVVSIFMILVGLSMPPILMDGIIWSVLAGHVILVTLLSNIGKMFPLLCYRKEASFNERLALCIGMFPRGEIGAGILIISIGYGVTGMPVIVAVFSLALNILLTGFFVIAVKKLIGAQP